MPSAPAPEAPVTLRPRTHAPPAAKQPWWDRIAYRLRLPVGRMRIKRQGQLGALNRLGRDVTAAVPNATGPKVLVIQIQGTPVVSAYASVIGQALRLRGSPVEMLTCGGGQPICDAGWSRHTYPYPCDRCAHYARQVAAAGRFPLLELAHELPWPGDGRRAPVAPDLSDLRQVERARDRSEVSAAWRHRSAAYMELPEGPETLEDFTVASLGVEKAVTRLLQTSQPDVAIIHNGLLAAENTAFEVARSMDIRVVSYAGSHRPLAPYFAHNRAAATFDTDTTWRLVSDKRLSMAEEAALDEYLTARASGSGTYETYFRNPIAGRDAIRSHLGVRPDSRLIVLFPNITWDSAALKRDIGFASMLDWIEHSLAIARTCPDVTLVIRSHPEEVIWESRERIHNAVMGAVSGETNIRVIRPDEPIDSYSLIDACDLALTYTSTVGLEAAARGKPVAVSGDVHYRGKGFTTDVSSPSELTNLLRGAVEPEPPAVDLARRYAYMFFFRIMIPIPSIAHSHTRVARLPGGAELAPNADPFVDFLCDRIIDGSPFLLPRNLALTGHR